MIFGIRDPKSSRSSTPFTFALPFGQRFSIPLRAGDLWFRACCFKELLGVWGKTCESSVRKYIVTKVSQVTWIYWQGKDFTPEAFWKAPEREFREAGRLVRRQGDTILNMIILSHSLDISKNELARYITSCLNSTFRLRLAEVRFVASLPALSVPHFQVKRRLYSCRMAGENGWKCSRRG